MSRDIAADLRRWQAAGILDEGTAERIRAYERAGERGGKLNVATSAALAFGAIMLAAGMLLFVAAHWDDISAWARFALVAGSLAAMHGLAALVRGRSEKVATTLHAIGTVALGGAIYLTGQIFNIEEQDRKSTRLNSSHANISYAVFCL